MFRRLLLVAVAALGFAALPGNAHAVGYTVYIYNTARRDGWKRTGFSHDLYTSRSACYRSIQSRVAENKRYRTDFEAFAIVYSTSQPPYGFLTSLPRGWSMQTIYVPGRGFLASASPSRGSPDGSAYALARPDAARLRHEDDAFCLA